MLPVDRSARHGRTFSRSWDAATEGSAVELYRKGVNPWDVLGWIATALLLCATFAAVYW